MSRRVVLGKQQDGTYALRCSLPGADALTLADDSNLLSYNSKWTDIVKISQAGLATVVTGGFINVAITNRGYIPYVETRALAAGVLYDDAGATGKLLSSASLQCRAANGVSVLYVVYKLSVPTQ